MSKGTTLRNFRADDDLWTAAREVAAERDESLSEVLRTALEEYVAAHR